MVAGKEHGMISYKCGKCRAKLETEDALGGQEERCPACGAMNKVPSAKKTNLPKVPKSVSGNRSRAVISGILLAGCLVGAGAIVFLMMPQRSGGDADKPATAPPIETPAWGKETVPAWPKEIVSEEGRQALAAFHRLDAKLDVGMTRAKFLDELGDAWASTKAFLESAAAEKCPHFSMAMQRAEGRYESSAFYWRLHIESDTTDPDRSRNESRMQECWREARLFLVRARAMADHPDVTEPRRLTEIEEILRVWKIEMEKESRASAARKEADILYGAGDPNADPNHVSEMQKEAVRWAQFKKWEALSKAKDPNAERFNPFPP